MFGMRELKKEPPTVIEICNRRFTFPLYTLNAERYSLPNCALIGDAAHTMHPMAGQGLNLGLLDANNLANAVCNSLNSGEYLGDSMDIHIK